MNAKDQFLDMVRIRQTEVLDHFDQHVENDQLIYTSTKDDIKIVVVFHEELTQRLQNETEFLFAYSIENYRKGELISKNLFIRFVIDSHPLIIAVQTEKEKTYCSRIRLHVKKRDPNENGKLLAVKVTDFSGTVQARIRHFQDRTKEAICALTTYRLPYVAGSFAATIEY